MNVYGDPSVAREMLTGEFRLLEIGDSKTDLMKAYWPKMLVGAVPFGGQTFIANGEFTSWIDSQGRGATRAVGFGGGGNFLPTSNYSLNVAFELQFSGFAAAAPLYLVSTAALMTNGTNNDPNSRRYQVSGNDANWLRGPNTVRVMLYGTGNDSPFVQGGGQNQTGASWGAKVTIAPAALGTYHYVDCPLNAFAANDDASPLLTWINGSAVVNGTRLACLGFRLFSNAPHWEYWSLSRGASSIDNYINPVEYSAAAWANVLAMLECTHVIINHGYNESAAYTEQDFYDRLVTMIGLLRQDNPTRRILLISPYNIAGAEAKTLRNAHAMQRIAADLPYVGFLDQRNDLPDVVANASYLDVGGVHPTAEGCVYFRANQIDLLRRLASSVGVGLFDDE